MTTRFTTYFASKNIFFILFPNEFLQVVNQLWFFVASSSSTLHCFGFLHG